MEYKTIRGNLMTMINQVNAFDEDELRKKIIKAAINLLDDDDFDGMDKMTKSALIRGVVREVIMEQYPEALDLLSKDENKQADAIYAKCFNNCNCINITSLICQLP